MFGVQRGGDRHGQLLGQLDQLPTSARRGNATSCHDHRSLRLCQKANGLAHRGHFGFRPKRRHVSERLLDDHVQLRLIRYHLSCDSDEVKVGRTRRPGGGLPEGLPEETGKLFNRIDERVALRHRVEGLDVIDLLVGVTILLDLRQTASKGDDRRAGQVGVLQSRGQVEHPDRLRSAYSDASADPSVAIRHVGSRLLSVGHDTSDSQTLKLGHRPGDDHWHEEEMGHAVPMKRFSEKAGSGHLGQLFTSSTGYDGHRLIFQSGSAAPPKGRASSVRADIADGSGARPEGERGYSHIGDLHFTP